MRYLFLLQGAPGSGKSTFVETEGLAPWTVASDTIRLLFRSPEQRRDGSLGINAAADRQVWQALFSVLEMRMEAGDLTVIDATHSSAREVEQYQTLAARYRYQCYVVTWRELALTECLKRNAGRPPMRRVPDDAVREIYARVREFVCPPWAQSIAPSQLRGVLKDPVIGGDRYRELHVIGDLQGCAKPLKTLVGERLSDEALYVFVGDLLDRGGENGEVMRLMLELGQKPNVRICEGNHERHLRSWAQGLVTRSRTFETATRPQLETAGIDKQAVAALLTHVLEAVVVNWRGQRVLICHGGLARLPAENTLAFVPSAQLINGVGPHNFDIDAVIAAHAQPGDIQVHGHRNEPKHVTMPFPHVFNLEGQVEFGGELRCVIFGDDGSARTRCIANPLSAEVLPAKVG